MFTPNLQSWKLRNCASDKRFPKTMQNKSKSYVNHAMYHVCIQYCIYTVPDDGHAAGLGNLIPGLQPKKNTSRYFRQQKQCFLPFHGFFACRDSRVISYHVWLKSFLLTSWLMSLAMFVWMSNQSDILPSQLDMLNLNPFRF